MSKTVLSIKSPHTSTKVLALGNTGEPLVTEDLGGDKFYTKLLVRHGNSHHHQLDGVPRGSDYVYLGLSQAGVVPALDYESALSRLIKANLGVLIKNLDKITGFQIWTVDRSMVITQDSMNFPNCRYVSLEQFKGLVVLYHSEAKTARPSDVKLYDRVSFKHRGKSDESSSIFEGEITLISMRGANIRVLSKGMSSDKTYFVKWVNVLKLLNDKKLTTF